MVGALWKTVRKLAKIPTFIKNLVSTLQKNQLLILKGARASAVAMHILKRKSRGGKESFRENPQLKGTISRDGFGF
jgi:hypothetical protein